MDNNEKTQDLLMHYGVIEKFSIKLYNQETSKEVEKQEIPVNQHLYNQVCKYIEQFYQISIEIKLKINCFLFIFMKSILLWIEV